MGRGGGVGGSAGAAVQKKNNEAKQTAQREQASGALTTIGYRAPGATWHALRNSPKKRVTSWSVGRSQQMTTWPDLPVYGAAWL